MRWESPCTPDGGGCLDFWHLTFLRAFLIGSTCVRDATCLRCFALAGGAHRRTIRMCGAIGKAVGAGRSGGISKRTDTSAPKLRRRVGNGTFGPKQGRRLTANPVDDSAASTDALEGAQEV